MSERIIGFHGFSVTAPSEWEDITDTLDGANMPFTLSRPHSGGGALQFSPALYRRGPVPTPSSANLLSMVFELGRNRELGEPFDATTFEKPIKGASVSFHWGDSFVRVWYLSRSGNIMLATFVCEWDRRSEEVAACEMIVRTVNFEKRKAVQANPETGQNV